jgi:hypothetical protein
MSTCNCDAGVKPVNQPTCLPASARYIRWGIFIIWAQALWLIIDDLGFSNPEGRVTG